jgi:F0F1-type ATP synthase membrane subunit c/vacuolar-type H+-ATPase subunit K
VIAYIRKTLASRLHHGRSLTLLAIVGVALGVASVFSVQLLNRNALAAFSGSMQSLSGDADLSVTGRTPTLPETLYPKVLATAGVSEAWPVYRIYVALEGHPGLFLEVAGLDLFAAGRLPLVSGDGEGTGSVGAAAALAGFLSRPGWVAVSPALAGEMGWSVGDTVTVSSGSRLADLHIGALVDFRRHTPLAPRKLAVMDIAQAQSLLGGGESCTRWT